MKMREPQPADDKLQKFDVMFAFFSYGGNGGTACLIPAIRRWWGQTVKAIANDPRIRQVWDVDISDTPITMTRNQAVMQARAYGADILVMIDSDNEPDLLVGIDPLAKPFWKSSLDFLIAHHHKGPCVIGAPYCGPPPHPIKGGYENIYIFHWMNVESDDPTTAFKMEQYTREQAAIMDGIRECAALPTGLIMYDLRVFELNEPQPGDELIGKGGWFYYEHPNHYAAEKASTEDVTATRDISLAGQAKLGYNPVFVNWSSWAGHIKPKTVGKPTLIAADFVNERYKRAVLANQKSNQRLIDVRANGDLERLRAAAPRPELSAILYQGASDVADFPEKEGP